MERASGIIMPIFSLPGKYGIGTMGKEARAFADFLNKAGQKYWQVLPLGPTCCGNSPYSSWSTFAGNPNLINIEELEEKDLVDKEFADRLSWGRGDVDYVKVNKNKGKVLRKAFENGYDTLKDEIYAFAVENSVWIYDYALYTALKEHFDMAPWYEWPEDIRLREKSAIESYSDELKEEIDYHIFVQYLFFEQWNGLKEYAHEKDIRFIGDLPIYVAMDSADVWASPQFFQLDEKNVPTAVAGVPPDYFSENGQLWGNPLYDWKAMEKDGYGWWIRRVDGARKLFDVIRIDHFRGLESYWAVPAEEETAINGRWEKGPGLDFIERIKGWFNGIEIIAEDLGILTDEVRQLLKDSGFPGMKVLEFAFDESGDSDYLPHKYERNCVCYGGTHDNATIREWKEKGSKKEIAFAQGYFGIGKGENFNFGIIRGGMASVADLFITQMQDYLELGAEARTNIPGIADGNWKWRMKRGAANDRLAAKILKMTKMYGRA
ncbi:MAG: 4-alpha-glucanotransferase [Clostridia bacterium]|nr:4-alpha-glucanotransferase [Clostridia bacterium]